MRDPESIEYTHHDYEDLKANPVWEVIEAELLQRYNACINELLKLDNPFAIEANLIMKLRGRPKELAILLEQEE